MRLEASLLQGAKLGMYLHTWVCIHTFPDLGYVKGIYFPLKVCKSGNFGEVTIK